jgi:hypothetical protein
VGKYTTRAAWNFAKPFTSVCISQRADGSNPIGKDTLPSVPTPELGKGFVECLHLEKIKRYNPMGKDNLPSVFTPELGKDFSEYFLASVDKKVT